MDFFVVGTSRSGSTLLRHMLAAHPDVGVLNESHWVPRMWDEFGSARVSIDELIAILVETRWDSGRRVIDVNLEIAGRAWEDLIAGLRERLGGSATIAAFHDAVVDTVFGATPGSIRRGDKTPDYGFYMPLLQQIWPAARVVHVVRNGIDTARSMARHSGCQLMISAGFDNWVPLSYGRIHERYERLDLPFDAYVGSWQRRMARIRNDAAWLRAGSYLEVRYEALVESPAAVLGEVAIHLNLEPSPTWLERCAGLVRSKPAGEAVVAETFRSLTVEHLRALNDVGGVWFLEFAPHAEPSRLEAALRRPAHAEEALKVALAALATRSAESDPGLAYRAVRVLREAVVSSGRNQDEWAVLRTAAVE